MKYSRILVPYDGSKGSQDAVRYALEMIEGKPEATIVAFASLAGPHDIQRLVGGANGVISYGGSKEAVNHYQELRDKAIAENMARLKEEVGEIAGDAPVEYHIDYSISPINGILKAVENYDIDAIVMGSRGESAFAGVLGSTSFGVIRGATVPVTVVK